MLKQNLKLQTLPAILLGEKADRVYLFVHGQSGCKEEAIAFANLACPRGYQVLGIDLPEHGERKAGGTRLLPWETVPEMRMVMEYLKANWAHVSLRANSIGAWLSLQSFADEKLDNALLVSPILDMQRLIEDMMLWAGVTPERLKLEQEIKTNFGQTLSWRYYTYAKEHPVKACPASTHILYASGDNMTARSTVNGFVDKFGCELTVMENGEHWFHTPEQLAFLDGWTERCV